MLSPTLTRAALAASCALGLAPFAAHAQQNALSDIPCPASTVTIAVMGDSLADGIWGAFFRAFSPCDTVEVLRLTSLSDGLARSDPSAWLGRLKGIEPDLTLISIGANDLVNMRSNRVRFIYGQSDWAVEYKARATTLAAGLKSASSSVIWLGLPVVGRADFEDSYRQITELHAAAAMAEDLAFVDTHAPTMFGQGAFVMNAKIDGTLRQMRHTDQVHFTAAGYDMVAGLTGSAVADLFDNTNREASLGALELQ